MLPNPDEFSAIYAMESWSEGHGDRNLTEATIVDLWEQLGLGGE